MTTKFSHLLARRLVASLLLLSASVAQADVKLPSIFGDHMVLQQDIKIPVWGWAEAGEEVTVTLGDKSAKTKASADGKWRVNLDRIKATSTPYTLTVKGRNTLKFEDVLVGDVWICSGQSNMGFSLWHVNNAQEEIDNAKYPGIRMFVVNAKFHPVPQENCTGYWIVCSPETAGVQGFSAVGYFFARELHQQLKIPIGMINSSVGATDAESWISLDGMKKLSQFKTEVEKAEAYAKDFTEKLPSYPAELAKYESDLAEALKKEKAQEEAWRAKIDGEDLGVTEKWMKVEISPEWKTFSLPDDYSRPSLGSYLGTVWCRKEVDIPSAWVGKTLELHVGVIDEADDSYVNGQKVGSTWFDVPEFFLRRRVYQVPASLVKSNRVSIAVRMVNRFGELGFFGPKNEMFLICKEVTGNPMSLAGEWYYRKGLEWKTADIPKGVAKPKELWSTRVAGSLFNGMIAPLTPYAIKGAIWYQGENNISRPAPYHELLPGLIASWRSAWNEGDFPFYIVQLANYGKATASVEKKSSAEVREAQVKTATNIPNSGLAVILDGVADGHPTDKAVVGKRLGLQALAKTYGKDVAAEGPMYKGMKVEDHRVRLSFNFAEGLQIRETHHTAGLEKKIWGFSVAGDDKVFYVAQAKIDGRDVVVWSDKVPKPVAVRYAWANNPLCNLYNGVPLPMVPFRTDQWNSSDINVAQEVAP